MVKKLRYKFILIMMSMVAAILLIVFAALVIANKESSVRNAEISMQQRLFSSLGKDRFMLPPDMKPNDVERKPLHMFPSVVIKIDNGEISRIDAREMEKDEATLNNWIKYARVNADTRGYGEIKSENIRFYIRSFEDKTDVIFTDFSFEVNRQRDFILLCFGGFLAGCLAFFVLSWFLSGWVVKPVKEAWDMQNQFIADASHELKTPLTVIIADTEILLSHEDSKVNEQKRWIYSIKYESLAMRKLIEDMLFIAKSDADRGTEEFSEFDISDIVTDKILEFEVVAYEKQVTLNDEIEKEIRAVGSREDFGRLISILLDNAIKYSEPDGSGEKKVVVSLNKTGKMLNLTVCNSCRTLDENTIKHAFDRFFRGDVTRNREDGSYGLGLSIAAEIVRAMNGKIRCSYKDGYAVFTVEMPESTR